MKELYELYAQMGISPAVYAYGEAAISRLRERFDAIDQVAEYNQAKVLQALQPPPAMATTTRAVTNWNRFMPMCSTPKQPWFAPTSPAAPMR